MTYTKATRKKKRDNYVPVSCCRCLFASDSLQLNSPSQARTLLTCTRNSIRFSMLYTFLESRTSSKADGVRFTRISGIRSMYSIPPFAPVAIVWHIHRGFLPALANGHEFTWCRIALSKSSQPVHANFVPSCPFRLPGVLSLFA